MHSANFGVWVCGILYGRIQCLTYSLAWGTEGCCWQGNCEELAALILLRAEPGAGSALLGCTEELMLLVRFCNWFF